MTEESLKAGQNLLKKIRSIESEMDDLNAMKQFIASGDTEDFTLTKSPTLSVSVPKNIVVNVVDTILQRYATQLKKAQEDFLAL